jgi:hypothetical protein
MSKRKCYLWKKIKNTSTLNKSHQKIHIGDKHYNLDILNLLLSILKSAEQTSQKVAEKESLFQQMRSLLSIYAIKGKKD